MTYEKKALNETQLSYIRNKLVESVNPIDAEELLIQNDEDLSIAFSSSVSNDEKNVVKNKIETAIRSKGVRGQYDSDYEGIANLFNDPAREGLGELSDEKILLADIRYGALKEVNKLFSTPIDESLIEDIYQNDNMKTCEISRDMRRENRDAGNRAINDANNNYCGTVINNIALLAGAAIWGGLIGSLIGSNSIAILRQSGNDTFTVSQGAILGGSLTSTAYVAYAFQSTDAGQRSVRAVQSTANDVGNWVQSLRDSRDNNRTPNRG